MEDTMIFSVHEVAKMLHSSPNYVYKLIEKGYEHTLLKDFFDIYEKLEFMVNA